MAQLSRIFSIDNLHGNTARVGTRAIAGFVGIAGIAIITITPKTITKR
ncbi:hypothetical protein [Trinickia sp.]